MQGKIVLEEHFAIPETLGDSQQYASADSWSEREHRLLDFQGERLKQMDANGVEFAILSLNAPAIQAITDPAEAILTARKANDALAEQVARHPDRFAGFAALPMQDPDAAGEELERSVRELGFKGALVNGFSQRGDEGLALYYDAPEYLPFWETAARLGVPFYLHPRDPAPQSALVYQGHPWIMGSAWAFGVETASHALRLMASGLFDRVRGLQIILGHLGESLPAAIWRVDHRIDDQPRGIPAKRPLASYLAENFHLTTSGNFSMPALISAMLQLGSDRIMFSIDYPFDSHEPGAKWMDTVAISEADRLKIARTNAVRLFGLKLRP
ncbi:MAG: amidohydrolase [Rhizobiales bacterium]|nr:amidohydrolase [Hyphomicrobiales bacterium]